jgi:MFS family permease
MPALARFLVVFAAGIAAAAAIGKLVPHIPRLAGEFDISLGAAGFLVSAVMLPGALAGPLFGALVDRMPPRRVACFGLALEALASAALPFASNLWLFLALRLLEGVGFVLMIVAGTLMVVAVSAPRHRAVALSTWSSFAPLGFALGQLFAADASYQAIAVGHALALAVMAALMASCIPAGAAPGAARANVVQALRHPPALRTAMAFGCVAGLLLGAVALAPLVVSPRAGITVADAARLTALAALPGIVGRFASGWLLGKSAPRRVFGGAAALALLFIPLALIAPVPLALALLSFAAFQICMGALAGILQAMLPQVAPTPAQLGTVTGLANQMITMGNLLGPPIVLAVFAAAGATAATALLILALALSVGLVNGVAAYRRALAP